MPRAAIKVARTTKEARKPKVAADRLPLPGDAVLLALDPSSTAIGWAYFVAGQLVLAGVVREKPSWPARDRMVANAEAVAGLLTGDGLMPTAICMEWQSHMNTRTRVSGLATLGQAQGYLRAILGERFPGVPIELVSEREWTRFDGKNYANVAKEVRARKVLALVPSVAAALAGDEKADRGLDMVDAAGLGLWRLGRIG